MKKERNMLHARRLHASYDLAITCAELGARIRTIRLLTGLSESMLYNLFREPLTGSRRGRHPDSHEWYHTAPLSCRVEASVVVALFYKLLEKGINPPLALVTAYRHYTDAYHHAPKISFDRAFDLVARTSGYWLASKPQFAILGCPSCQSEYLTSVRLAPSTNHECPFCKLLVRYSKDFRIRNAYPARTLPRNTLLLWFTSCAWEVV
jgi:hypothetical protein